MVVAMNKQCFISGLRHYKLLSWLRQELFTNGSIKFIIEIRVKSTIISYQLIFCKSVLFRCNNNIIISIIIVYMYELKYCQPECEFIKNFTNFFVVFKDFLKKISKLFHFKIESRIFLSFSVPILICCINITEQNNAS